MSGADNVKKFTQIVQEGMLYHQEWLSVLSPLIGSELNKTAPELKPLADMLRRRKHVDPLMCDILAELLDPEEPNVFAYRLCMVPAGTERKIEEPFERWKPVSQAYERCRKEGLKSDDAKAKVAEEFAIDERTVMRFRANWKRRLGRIKRLGGG